MVTLVPSSDLTSMLYIKELSDPHVLFLFDFTGVTSSFRDRFSGVCGSAPFDELEVVVDEPNKLSEL